MSFVEVIGEAGASRRRLSAVAAADNKGVRGDLLSCRARLPVPRPAPRASAAPAADAHMPSPYCTYILGYFRISIFSKYRCVFKGNQYAGDCILPCLLSFVYHLTGLRFLFSFPIRLPTNDYDSSAMIMPGKGHWPHHLSE